MSGRRRRLASAAGSLGLLLFSVALVALGPYLVDGHAALQWTRFHAAAAGPVHVQEAARWAVRAASSLAPLPQAAEAAALALEAAARAQPDDPRAARAACEELRAGLEPLASSWRGKGLQTRLEEARPRAAPTHPRGEP
jgi:uncharacterized membrane protein YcjF (UPF0283 family)